MLPKPAFKYSEALRQTPPQFQSNERGEAAYAPLAEAVVTCPECATSFAIEQNLLSGAKSPKFHCSKCDSIFSAAATTPGQTLERHIESAETPSVGTYKRTNASRSNYGQSSVRASDFSIGTKSVDDSAVRVTQTPTQVTTYEVQTTARAGISLLEASSEELDGEFEDLSFYSDAHAALPDQPTDEISPAVERASITEKLFSGGFEIGPASKQGSTPQPKAQPKQTQVSEPRSPARHQETSLNRIDEETFNQALEAQQGLLQRGWQKLSSRNRGLIAMSLPLLATLGSLLLLTPLTSLSPQSVGALIETAATSIISSPISQTPPSSLAIKKATLKFVRTRSNEALAVISGELVNTSSSKISGVDLEALVFNRRGEMLASSRAQLRSALASEDISDLNLQTVKKFQNSLNARSASIGAGETVPFTIAILNESAHRGRADEQVVDLSRVKYFSARVFAVN